MDVLDMIRKEHDELKEQLEALVALAVIEPEESVDVFYSFRQRLAAHNQAEEQLLFSRLRDRREATDIIDGAWEQHAAIELYVQRMHRSHKMVRWPAKTTLLRSLAEQHMAGEEQAVFDVVRGQLGDELDLLGPRFEEENQKLLVLIPM